MPKLDNPGPGTVLDHTITRKDWQVPFNNVLSFIIGKNCQHLSELKVRTYISCSAVNPYPSALPKLIGDSKTKWSSQIKERKKKRD